MTPPRCWAPSWPDTCSAAPRPVRSAPDTPSLQRSLAKARQAFPDLQVEVHLDEAAAIPFVAGTYPQAGIHLGTAAAALPEQALAATLFHECSHVQLRHTSRLRRLHLALGVAVALLSLATAFVAAWLPLAAAPLLLTAAYLAHLRARRSMEFEADAHAVHRGMPAEDLTQAILHMQRLKASLVLQDAPGQAVQDALFAEGSSLLATHPGALARIAALPAGDTP